jgi:hypothetical protein
LDRTQLIAETVGARDGHGSPFGRLQVICHVAVEMCGVDGAGVMLMTHRHHQGTAYATDPTIQSLEDLQNGVGEGPCLQAYLLGRPVFAPDLAGSQNPLWPRLAGAALEAGMGALFGFSLQLDDTSIGALDLYRHQPGELTATQAHDGRLLAAMATRSVLAMQEQSEAGSLPSQIQNLSGERATIEQAVGMTAGAHGLHIGEAKERLRAHSRTTETALAELAAEVIAGRTTVP